MSYRNSKGFTLIELMVVLVIVGIMLALLIPNVGGFISQMEINEATQNLSGVLRSAKETAVSKNVTARVIISDANKTYRVERTAIPGTNEPAGWIVIQTDTPISIKGNIGLQTNATAFVKPLTTGIRTITFTSRGTALADATGGNNGGEGTIYLQPDREFNAGATQKMRAIDVSMTTGRIRIYQWIGGGWQ